MKVINMYQYIVTDNVHYKNSHDGYDLNAFHNEHRVYIQKP